jgi:phosphatidylglycerol lysyltransferase
VTKWGEEPIVDLRDTNWQGKAYEWLRRQENACHRQGVTLREVNATLADPEFQRLLPELWQVSEQHVKSTPQGREMRVFDGRFTPDNLGHRRLFLAERDGRIEAFLVLNPALAGKMWAIEIYRRRQDAPQGVIPFAMLRAMRMLKQEGVEFVSLSLVPALRTDSKRPGDSRQLRRGLVFWREYLGWLFDMKGLYHYKSRFRPAYRNLYVAAYPRQTFSSLMSMMSCWGVLRVKPGGFLTTISSTIKNRKSRRQLCTPTRKQERAFLPSGVSSGLLASEPMAG